MLVTLARGYGIAARHLGLDGHVVMEAWYDGDWHMFDPTKDVVPVADGEVLSLEELAARPDLVRALYTIFRTSSWPARITPMPTTKAPSSSGRRRS